MSLYGSVSRSGQTRVADFSQQVSPAKYRIEAQEFPLGEPEFGMRPLVSHVVRAKRGRARRGSSVRRSGSRVKNSQYIIDE